MILIGKIINIEGGLVGWVKFATYECPGVIMYEGTAYVQRAVLTEQVTMGRETKKIFYYLYQETECKALKKKELTSLQKVSV